MFIEKFSELKKRLTSAGYLPDSLSMDCLVIENNRCPRCGANYAYKGVSNADEYLAFGVCESCDVARYFWMEGVAIAVAKKSLFAFAPRRKNSAII